MTAAYDAIAEWYDRSVRERALLASDNVIGQAFFALLGDIAGQSICDLACGQGYLARKVAQRGARIVGVDISRKLLDIAQTEEQAEARGIRYYHADAQALPALPEEPFDGVYSNMALMDIPNLTATLRGVARLLRPGGWFVATITHPCFQVPPGQSYFTEGFWRSDNPNGVRGQVGAHHRTLATYLNTLSSAGLLVEQIAEPSMSDRETPPVLLIRCRKG